MAERNHYVKNIRGDFGDLLTLGHYIIDTKSIEDDDYELIHHLVSAFSILESQLRHLNEAQIVSSTLSIKGQALDSIKNALELLSIKDDCKISNVQENISVTQEEIDKFLEKWRKKKIKV